MAFREQVILSFSLRSGCLEVFPGRINRDTCRLSFTGDVAGINRAKRGKAYHIASRVARFSDADSFRTQMTNPLVASFASGKWDENGKRKRKANSPFCWEWAARTDSSEADEIHASITQFQIYLSMPIDFRIVVPSLRKYKLQVEFHCDQHWHRELCDCRANRWTESIFEL
jgi:hypothetical protein